MAIPDFQAFMRPVLQTIEDGQEWHFSDVLDQVYTHFDLTEEEIGKMLPSGKQTYAKNRCGWREHTSRKLVYLLSLSVGS